KVSRSTFFCFRTGAKATKMCGLRTRSPSRRAAASFSQPAASWIATWSGITSLGGSRLFREIPVLGYRHLVDLSAMQANANQSSPCAGAGMISPDSDAGNRLSHRWPSLYNADPVPLRVDETGNAWHHAGFLEG